MAFTTVAPNQEIASAHINQFVLDNTGITGQGQSHTWTQFSGTDYVVRTKNLFASGASSGRAFLAEDPTGNIYARMANFGAASVPVANAIFGTYMRLPLVVGNLDFTHPNNPAIAARWNDYAGTPVAGQSYTPIVADVNLANWPTDGFGGTVNVPDSSAISGIIRIVDTGFGASQHGDVAARAVEAQALLWPNCFPRTVAGAEVGIHNGRNMNSHADLSVGYDDYFGAVGINIISTGNGGAQGFGAGARANHGIVMWGDLGFKKFIQCYDTNQTTTLFQVGQSGEVTIAGTVALAGSGQRIISNWEHATVTNRPHFQSSAANGNTHVGLMPSGSNTVSSIRLNGSSNLAATDIGYVQMTGGTGLEIGTTHAGGTNRDIFFSAGGTQGASFRAADGFINFLLGNVALGGGAAPTLGTIGGTGPATAAQSGWLKIYIGGVARFIPVWA